MRPKIRSIRPHKANRMSLVSTPYEGQRRRLLLLERIEAVRLDTSIARARETVARTTRLTTEQLVNIRKRRLKDLYGEIKTRIDQAFVAAATDLIEDFRHELVLADASARPIDPGVVAKALASRDALEQLIREAAGAGAARASTEAPRC